MRTASLEEARASLGDLIDRARLAGEPTLITRYGRAAAVVVSEDWYQLAEQSLTASANPAGTIIGPSGGTGDE